MRAIIQRVENAKVDVDDFTIGEIGHGLLVFLGVGEEDTKEDLDYMVDKVLNLRIFEDDEGKMNLSLIDVEGEILVVSQFTLYGDVRRGRRPSFSDSAGPDKGNEYYEMFIEACKERGVKTETGEFGADMKVDLLNDGPVTIMVDSEKVF